MFVLFFFFCVGKSVWFLIPLAKTLNFLRYYFNRHCGRHTQAESVLLLVETRQMKIMYNQKLTTKQTIFPAPQKNTNNSVCPLCTLCCRHFKKTKWVNVTSEYAKKELNTLHTYQSEFNYCLPWVWYEISASNHSKFVYCVLIRAQFPAFVRGHLEQRLL